LVHLTPQGNALLAQAVCARLIADSSFQSRYALKNGSLAASNVSPDAHAIKEVRSAVGRDSFSLRNFVENIIAGLADKRFDHSENNVPTEMYTTF
jgi:hypothetical protein